MAKKTKTRITKTRLEMLATIAVFRGNESVSISTPIAIPLTRTITMHEITMLWTIERTLNALPLPAGWRVAIDLSEAK